MSFKTAAQLGSYLSKDYAQEFFSLLVSYQDISASEAASRLDIHIRTAQDFLEGLAKLGIVAKEEVHEKKRPYYRYSLLTQSIKLELDLSRLQRPDSQNGLDCKIREKAHSGAGFAVARGGDTISTVTLWSGEGRDRKERRINLTTPQGQFLYHLPFPNAEPLPVGDVMKKAGVEETFSHEILDIVWELEKHGVIEQVAP